MLSKRVRIEVYLPERRASVYRRLAAAVEDELLYTFGGCTVVSGIKGLYLHSGEKRERDTISLIYADMPFGLKDNFKAVSAYADAIREAAAEALPEQSVLVVIHEIYHSN